MEEADGHQQSSEDRPQRAHQQQPGQVSPPLRRGNFLGEQSDGDAELRPDEHLGAELEGRERPEAPAQDTAVRVVNTV